MTLQNKIKTIDGGFAKGALGTLKYINDFNFKNVKRFYQIDFPKRGIIRAFHGHLKETKYVYAVEGNTLLCVVKLSSNKNPSKKAPVQKTLLSGKNPQIIQIPPGFANGIKSLSKNAKVIFFSSFSLNQSLRDDFRFPYDYWGKDVWKNQ